MLKKLILAACLSVSVCFFHPEVSLAFITCPNLSGTYSVKNPERQCRSLNVNVEGVHSIANLGTEPHKSFQTVQIFSGIHMNDRYFFVIEQDECKKIKMHQERLDYTGEMYQFMEVEAKFNKNFKRYSGDHKIKITHNNGDEFIKINTERNLFQRAEALGGGGKKNAIRILDNSEALLSLDENGDLILHHKSIFHREYSILEQPFYTDLKIENEYECVLHREA